MWRSRSTLRTSDKRLELEDGFCWCVLVDMLTHLPFLEIFISLLFFSSAPSLYHLYCGVGLPEASHLTISLLPSSTNTGFFIRLSEGGAAEQQKENCVIVLIFLTSACGRVDAVMEQKIREGCRERKIQKSILAGQMMSPETLAVWGSSLFLSIQRWALSALRDQCSTFTTLKNLPFVLLFTFMDNESNHAKIATGFTGSIRSN